MHSGILCVTDSCAASSFSGPSHRQKSSFFLGNKRNQGHFTNWTSGTGCAPSSREGLVGTTMGPTQSTGSRQHPPGGNVRTGNILFGISFYLWCLFQLYCRFLMDSHFPCSFPSSNSPNPCRHRLSQQVRHHWQLCLGSGEGQAHPLLPCPTTHQALGDVGSCPNPKLLSGVGSVPGFETGGGE